MEPRLDGRAVEVGEVLPLALGDDLVERSAEGGDVVAEASLDLAAVAPLTLGDLRASFRKVFWDSDRGRMVSLSEVGRG